MVAFKKHIPFIVVWLVIGLIGIGLAAYTVKIDDDLDYYKADSEIDHGGIGGLGDDDHTHYLLADGSRELTGGLTVSDDVWIGLGAAAGRIEFDDQSTDEINFLDCNVGIGTASPDSIFHIKANTPGAIGSHPAGQLIIQDPDDTVFGNAVITGYESDGAGNPDQQLWYLGSSSSSNTDIIFLNRRNANLHLGTNGVSHLTILGNGNVGIGTATPSAPLNVVGGVDIDLPADDNITIDGRTNPRTVTVGAMRWNLTPDASTPNTRALFLDIDANGVPNTQGLHIDLKGTSLAAGETVIGLDIVGDTANSGGGVIRLLELDKTGVGSAEVHGIHIEPEIEEVIHHASGVFIDPTQGWDENGGFTDTTTAFGSSGTDVTIFDADNDAIYIGADAAFQEVEVVMNTGASNPGIKPTFEIWTGASWTPITPVDNTAGFRESGIIDMEDSDLSSWAATSVNGEVGSYFYLQITRTQANLTVDPIEDLIQTAAVTDYIWDKDGNVNINDLDVAGSILATMAADQETSITIDGTTTDYSGSGVPITIQLSRDLDVGSNEIVTAAGIQNYLNPKHSDGKLPNGITTNYGIINRIDNDANITNEGAGIDYFNQYGVYAWIDDDATYDTDTASAIWGDTFAVNAITDIDSEYKDTGGIQLATIQGVWGGVNVDVDYTPTLTSGGANPQVAGVRIDVDGNTEGSSIARGLHILGTSGCDSNYAVYDGSDAPWMLYGNNKKVHFGLGNGLTGPTYVEYDGDSFNIDTTVYDATDDLEITTDKIVINASTGVGSILDEDNMASDSATALATQQSIKKYVDDNAGGGVASGATLPGAPTIGDFFLHTPTGRTILLEYDGSNWVPIYAYGTLTTYVDATDGTDDPDGGTAVDGDAFATIQYAIDCIPPLFSGDVTININAEAYAEDVVIGGKTPTGDYVIKLVGTLTANDAGLTAEAASVQGTGATQGTVVDTNQINNALVNELVCLDPGGVNEEYRIIDVLTGNDTITICGTWSVDPDGETFTTYEWGTEIQSITVKSGQKVIEVYNVKFPATGDITEPTFGFTCSVFVEWFASVTFYRCYFPNSGGGNSAYSVVGYYCSLILYQCSFVNTDDSQGLYGGEMANVTINGTKFDGGGNSVLAIRPSNIANFRLNRGTVLDNCDHAQAALSASLNCVVNTLSDAADGYNRIRNSTVGIKVNFGSQVKNTSSVQYSGNGTNESADAATFAYID